MQSPWTLRRLPRRAGAAAGMLAGLCATAGAASAHARDGHVPADLAHAWTLDPWVVGPLLAVGVAYIWGTARLWRRAAVGRGVRIWQAACFGGGLLALFLALVWPLDAIGEVLFWVHMVQHMVLMEVAPPLLLLGAPAVPAMTVLPAALSRGLVALGRRKAVSAAWRFCSAPGTATALMAATLWLWHAPAAVELALGDDAVHSLMHASFFATGLLFWWSLLRIGRGGRLDYGYGAVALLATMAQMGMLGALLTFAQVPLYPTYIGRTTAWGMSAIADQQLAGLIMWVPASLPYLVGGLVLVAAWLRDIERRAARRAERWQRYTG